MGDNPCVLKKHCPSCKAFTADQVQQLAFPTYRTRKENEQKKTVSASPVSATPTLLDPSEVKLFGRVEAIIVNKYCHHISYLSSDWPTSSTIDQSDDSFQNVAMLFICFCNSSSVYVVQTKQSKQLLTKEICLLSEATTYIFLYRNV